MGPVGLDDLYVDVRTPSKGSYVRHLCVAERKSRGAYSLSISRARLV